MKRLDPRGRLFLISLLAALAVLACPFIGATAISPLKFLGAAEGSLEQRIFWELRAPRVAMAFLAGASLALGGVVFQALFRNELACPFTLGVSSGAALGVALYGRFAPIALGNWGFPMSWLAGMCGALATVLCLFALATRAGGFASGELLLAGVVINLFFGSLILFLQFLGDYGEIFRTSRWLMGGLETVGFETLATVALLTSIPALLLVRRSRELDVLSLGEDLAISRGLDLMISRRRLCLLTSLMVGSTVAACGPIGFVGIMVPHVVRLVLGPRNFPLAVSSVLAGGAFLTVCDTAARSIIAPSEIPVGVITALLGGPFFLVLMLRRAGAWRA